MHEYVTATLAQQMGIDETEIAERMALLEFGEADVAELVQFSRAADEIADLVVDEFYRHQLQIPEIRRVIGDADTLGRLNTAMTRYVARLCSGDYGESYANSRLRIGRVHARIGVPPRLYVASLHFLKATINRHLMRSGLLEGPPDSLEKLFMLDLEFAFDAYVHTLLWELGTATGAWRGGIGAGMMLAVNTGHATGADPEPEPALDEAMHRAMRGDAPESAAEPAPKRPA